MYPMRIYPFMISDLFPAALPFVRTPKNEEEGGSKGKVCAVMVGISDYKSISDLNYCDDDVVDMKAALVKSKMWQNANIKTLIDKEATKEAIKNSILEYSGKLGPEDTFLFFNSSHGTNSNKKACLCPYDTTYSGGNLITETELKDWLKSLAKDPEKPPKVAVMIDSCYSGGFIDDKSLVPRFVKLEKSKENFKGSLTKELSSLKNSVVLTASAASEVSYETGKLQNGLFAYYVVEGVGNEAGAGPGDENKDKKVSMEETYKYSNPKVVNFEGLKDRQHPQISDKLDGEFIIKE